MCPLQIDQIFHGTDIFLATLKTKLAATLGDFGNEIQMTAGRDSTICSGPEDVTTCFMGAICGSITDREVLIHHPFLSQRAVSTLVAHVLGLPGT